MYYLLQQIMDSIRGMFSTVNRTSKYGVEGYHVDHQYFDANKSRQEKQFKKLGNSRSMTSRAKDSGKKETFIDQIQKRQAKLPGPSSYRVQPDNSPEGSKKKLKQVSPSPRQTIFDEMSRIEKKRNYPAANKYDPESSLIEHHKSGLSKAINANYLEGAMGDHLWVPGVGQYNPVVRHANEGKKGHRWVEGKTKKSKSLAVSKFPPVGTYNPTQQDTFAGIAASQKSGGKKNYFSREKRFQSSKQKAVPFYCIESEWGMNERQQKKDILSKISPSLTHHSIYY